MPKSEEKPPVGRPSIYSDAIATAICEDIVLGLSIREIAAKPDMPGNATIWRWIATNEEFQGLYARAKESQAERFAEELLEIADDGSNDWVVRRQGEDEIVVADHEHIQRSRLRVDARKWLMAKMLPKKYGDKTQVEHSGELKLSQIDDHTLNEQIVAAMVASGISEAQARAFVARDEDGT